MKRPIDTRNHAQHIGDILPRVLKMIERQHERQKGEPRPCSETVKATV